MENQVHLIFVLSENIAHLEVIPIRHVQVLDHLFITLALLRALVLAILSTTV